MAVAHQHHDYLVEHSHLWVILVVAVTVQALVAAAVIALPNFQKYQSLAPLPAALTYQSTTSEPTQAQVGQAVDTGSIADSVGQGLSTSSFDQLSQAAKQLKVKHK